MALGHLVRQEQLRFLRQTALRLRAIGDGEPTTTAGPQLLRMAREIEREADDLEVISLGNGDAGAR